MSDLPMPAMAAAAVLRLRKDELARRVASMPRELAAWDAAVRSELDLQLHFSQLRAIRTLADALAQAQRSRLDALDPGGAAADFQTGAQALMREIQRGQLAWDFFRDKLDLRRSCFKEQLWAADTVAWDCHRPVLDAAVKAGVLDPEALREPPLVYLGTSYSPLTWVRRARPNDGRRYDLGEATLPIPVIELPWDHIGNGWELLSLHHEVAHDIEADLGLRAALRQGLSAALTGAGVPPARIAVWVAWQGEVFADLCAIRLAGTGFVEALMHLLLLAPDVVCGFDDTDPHPTPYLRILMNAAYLRHLLPGQAPLQADAERLVAQWQALYAPNPELEPYLADLPLVFRGLMDSPLAPLKGLAVRDLVPYAEADDARIRAAADYFVTGQQKPVGLRPRHCVASARLALSTLAQAGPVADQTYDQLQERLLRLVKAGAPPGLRGGVESPAHRSFIARFAKEVFT